MPASTKFHLAGREISQSQFTVELCNLKKNLSVPSVVFAEANWYGSLRGGIEFSGGETNFYDGASRWGIKGSAEASEGLTAVYRFEHKFSTSDAGQAGGRLAYVGLSGGFGTLTLGQIWSASYIHAGVIRDFPNWYTSPDTTGRIGNALSYSVSNDAFSMQVDAIMNGKKNTGGAIDQLEFGMTVNVGEVGKVALAHTTVKDETVKFMTERIPGTPYVPAVPGRPAMDATYWVDHDGDEETEKVEAHQITVYLTGAQHAETGTPNVDADGVLTAAGLLLIERTGDRYHMTGALAAECKTLFDDKAATTDDCVPVTAYVRETSSARRAPGAPADQATTTTFTETFYAEAEETPADPGTQGTPEVKGTKETPPMEDTKTVAGSKASHISAEFGLGAITAAVGYSEHKVNRATGKTKTTFIGAKGGIGDTGLSWGAYSRVKDKADGTKEKPWTIGLSKSLGGGAWAYIEHHNDGVAGDSSRSTAIALGVSF